MNKKRRVLSFLMALVMVLGVMAVLPITVSAKIDVFDIRYAYEFIKANDTDNKYTDTAESYKTIDTVPYVASAPVLDGTIDEVNYSVKNPVITRSYAQTASTMSGSSPAAQANGKNSYEYFAQDANYVYIAFVMPDYCSNVAPRLVISNPYAKSYGIASNYNLSDIWNSWGIQFETNAEGNTTIGTNGGAASADTGLKTANWTTTMAETVAFKAPSGEDTNAYIEYKLKKSDLVAVLGNGVLQGIGYNFRFASMEEGEVQWLNWVSNALVDGAVKTAAALDNAYKQLYRYLKLADWRYELPSNTTTITSVSAVAPSQDGTISQNEYSATAEYGGMTQYAAIDSGYLYVAYDTGVTLTPDSTYFRVFAGNTYSYESSQNCGLQFIGVASDENITTINYSGWRACNATQQKSASGNRAISWASADNTESYYLKGKMNVETGVIE